MVFVYKKTILDWSFDVAISNFISTSILDMEGKFLSEVSDSGAVAQSGDNVELPQQVIRPTFPASTTADSNSRTKTVATKRKRKPDGATLLQLLTQEGHIVSPATSPSSASRGRKTLHLSPTPHIIPQQDITSGHNASSDICSSSSASITATNLVSDSAKSSQRATVSPVRKRSRRANNHN